MIEAYIPYSTQDIDDADIAAVCDVLKSSFITQGPTIERFEAAIGDYCAVPHAVAVSSGTAAIHIALAALDIANGSRVWTSPMTFVGTANAARMLGAEVGFVDIDPTTGNIDLTALAAALADADRAARLPQALIVVHYTGRPCDMPAIRTLCQAHGISLIEDAAHALGATHDSGAKVGSAHYSDVCIFSFHPVKTITTGEGGMVTTRSAKLADRLRRLRSHGTSRNKRDFVSSPRSEEDRGNWYYEQLELGYNYRLTDIQAALGLSQMKRIEMFISARRNLAERYARILEGLPLHLPPASNHSAWHLYVVRLAEAAKSSRRQVYDILQQAQIGANVHYIPVHLQPYYSRLGFRDGDFPVSEAFYRRALSLPLFPKLTHRQQDRVAAVIRIAVG